MTNHVEQKYSNRGREVDFCGWTLTLPLIETQNMSLTKPLARRPKLRDIEAQGSLAKS